MSQQNVLTNARVVLADRVIDGTVVMTDGRITDVDEKRASMAGAEDFGGDHLIAGLVDLHADSLEKHIEPRRKVFWDGMAAAVAHDAVTIAAGVTTVFDAVCIGEVVGRPAHEHVLESMFDGLDKARRADALRADHLVHLRCEVTDPDVMRILEPRLSHDMVGLVSVMDHAPGHRQMKDATYLKESWMIGTRGMTPDEADREIDELMRRSREVAPVMRVEVTRLAHECGIVVASHDDETVDHIALADELGIGIAEFPTTEEAAREAKRRGISVLMGGPNLVRGGSHSGNVAAGDLAGAGILDALTSDYIMSSMLMGALALTRDEYGIPLHEAMATVTESPARIAGLDDRGRIAPGLRADLVRVRLSGENAIVRAVWREGTRVY